MTPAHYAALHYRDDRRQGIVGQLVTLDGAGQVTWSSGWRPDNWATMTAREHHEKWAAAHGPEVAILALRCGPTMADDYALMFHPIELPWDAAVGAGAIVLKEPRLPAFTCDAKIAT